MGIASAIGNVAGALIGADASRKAANTQADSAKAAQELQYRMFQEQNALQEPFRQAGMTGQNRLMELLGVGGNTGAQGYGMYANAPTLNDLQMDPGYGFRFGEGMKALNAQAAARGGLISGGALKAAERYGQDMGSQEYQNAFNRYQLNKSSMLNPLQSLAGQGQTAANTMTSAAGNYANNAGEMTMQAGNARASGYIGGANALNQGIGNYLKQQDSNNWLAALRNQGGNSYYNQMPGMGYQTTPYLSQNYGEGQFNPYG